MRQSEEEFTRELFEDAGERLFSLRARHGLEQLSRREWSLFMHGYLDGFDKGREVALDKSRCACWRCKVEYAVAWLLGRPWARGRK